MVAHTPVQADLIDQVQSSSAVAAGRTQPRHTTAEVGDRHRDLAWLTVQLQAQLDRPAGVVVGVVLQFTDHQQRVDPTGNGALGVPGWSWRDVITLITPGDQPW
jgi:hypothetical protein